ARGVGGSPCGRRQRHRIRLVGQREVSMRGIQVVMVTATLGLAAGAMADEIQGTFHFGKTRFTPKDALAFQVDGKEPGKPMTVVVLTDFKIDRPAAMAAIDTT